MGMEGLRPFVSEVVVPTHAKPVEIVRFWFSHALDSMYSDCSLMKPPNVVINQPLSGKDPYALYESPGNLLNKVHSGSSFQNAYQHKINDPSCQFLIFLIFFIDKTGIDGMQRFGLEPLRFTLSIFKRGVRVHSFAWRNLGYVPDLSNLSSAENKRHQPGDKLSGFHICLDKILEDVVAMQKDGFPLMLKLLKRKPPRPYTIFFSHGFTIGDCKGNNILAGRYGTFTSKCALISRTCDCPLQKANDPHYQCKFLTQQLIESACALSNVTARNKALQDMSYHYVPNNAFYKLCSAGNIFGIHGCTPVNPMHALLLGTLKYVMTGFCGDASPLCPSDQGRLDIIIKDFLRLLRCTARAFFPRCDYTNGLTNLTLTTANKNSGAIFMLLLLWATETGRTLMKALKGHSVETLQSFRYTFQYLLVYEYWTKQEEFWSVKIENDGVSRRASKMAQEATIHMMDTIKKASPRTVAH